MNKDNINSNLKYLSRCQYYGTLENWEYVNDAMVLIFKVYTATEYFGNETKIRVYVPTKLEVKLNNELEIGENYLVITAPYRVNFKQKYRHRVDLLIAIFREVI
jgi:hypothetical protein